VDALATTEGREVVHSSQEQCSVVERGEMDFILGNIPKHWCFERLRQFVSECATDSHPGKNLETAPNWHWNSQKRHAPRVVSRVGVYVRPGVRESAGVCYLAEGCADAVGRQAVRRVNGSGGHGGAGRQLRLAELRLYVERRRSAVGRAGDRDRVVGGSHRRGAHRVAVLLVLLGKFHLRCHNGSVGLHVGEAATGLASRPSAREDLVHTTVFRLQILDLHYVLQAVDGATKVDFPHGRIRLVTILARV
jgi:hypothetical protein